MYESLFSQYKGQKHQKIFAFFGWNKDIGESWEAPFLKLALKAKNENWNFERPEFMSNGTFVPILASYLNFTFLRLQQQDKIKYSQDSSKACINLGLQTPEGKDIFATFFKNQNAETRGQPDWTLYGYFDAFSDKVSEFDPLPDIATYIDDPAELVYDHRLEWEVDHSHILNDNKDRLPPVLQGNSALARNAVDGAIRQLKDRLKRNYKLAVPHWYHDRIQLLLPLCITDDNIADVALVAEKVELGAKQKYKIRTSLDLAMAYMDARIICAPDRGWLNP